MSAGTVTTADEMRQGWPVVLTCFCVAVFTWGIALYGQSVLLAELHKAHGWSTGTIGGATSVSFLLGAGLLAWVGPAIRKLGARAVLTGGVIVLGLGAIGLSRVNEPWQLYPCNLVMGLGWAGCSVSAISIVVKEAFDHRLGLALNLALSGASAGGFTVAPMLVTLTAWNGLPTAVGEVVLVLLAAIVPIVWFGIRDRKPNGVASAIRPGPAPPALAAQSATIRTARFWSVAGPFALAIFAQVGMLVYQVSYLLPLLGPSGTSLALACTSVSALVGRLVFGAFADRLNQRTMSALSFTCQAAALILMIALPDIPAALYVGSVLFGLFVGYLITLPSVIIGQEFEANSFGLVVGLSSAVGQAAWSFAPALLGVVRDVTGTYSAGLAVCIALQLAAAVLVVRRPRPRMARGTA